MKTGVAFLVAGIAILTVSKRLSSTPKSGVRATMATLANLSALRKYPPDVLARRRARKAAILKSLFVVGVVLCMVAAFFLPPVTLVERLSFAPWARTLAQGLGAVILGAGVSKLWLAVT